MNNITKLVMTAAFLASATAASAQTTTQNEQQSTQQERINSILGALFGDRTSATETLDSQWAAGRTPLASQRTQFETRVDSDVRVGAINQTTATRLKTDYADLVQLEMRYGSDRVFTSQERSDLTQRYNALTQILANQTYADAATTPTSSVESGQTAFITRVDALVSARRMTRVAATRLKSDYTLLVQTERNYLRDGVLDDRERDDLDARLDALDARVGDTTATTNLPPPTARARLSAIGSAISSSRLSAVARTQLQVEHRDLTYLESAYSRLTPTADEQRYLENRLSNLEQRLQIRPR